MLILTSNALNVVELSVGFETNLNNNASRKFEKYRYLLHDLKSKYRLDNFVSLSISSLGIFGQSCNSFIEMYTDLSINTDHNNYLMTKLTSIIIRTTYYIFCMRNRPCTNPELVPYCLVSPFSFSSSCYTLLFFFSCSIEISACNTAEYKLPNIREICICMLSLCT